MLGWVIALLAFSWVASRAIDPFFHNLFIKDAVSFEPLVLPTLSQKQGKETYEGYLSEEEIDGLPDLPLQVDFLSHPLVYRQWSLIDENVVCEWDKQAQAMRYHHFTPQGSYYTFDALDASHLMEKYIEWTDVIEKVELKCFAPHQRILFYHHSEDGTVFVNDYGYQIHENYFYWGPKDVKLRIEKERDRFKVTHWQLDGTFYHTELPLNDPVCSKIWLEDSTSCDIDYDLYTRGHRYTSYSVSGMITVFYDAVYLNVPTSSHVETMTQDDSAYQKAFFSSQLFPLDYLRKCQVLAHYDHVSSVIQLFQSKEPWDMQAAVKLMENQQDTPSLPVDSDVSEEEFTVPLPVYSEPESDL